GYPTSPVYRALARLMRPSLFGLLLDFAGALFSLLRSLVYSFLGAVLDFMRGTLSRFLRGVCSIFCGAFRSAPSVLDVFLSRLSRSRSANQEQRKSGWNE